MSEGDGNTGVRVLGRALEQFGDLLDHVHREQLEASTPCEGWTISALIDHVIAALPNFQIMMRGEEADWSAPPPHVAEGWAGTFRSHADDLMHAWHQAEAAGTAVAFPPEVQTAEFAVHSWDLARAIDWPVDKLDPQVAERGLAFMQQALKPEMRGEAFSPEQPAPPGAGPYEAIAAFAGRRV
jgi:uncharacterized protein (TIGR03086 family)